MPATWTLTFLIVTALAVRVTADAGDDFSNNLFSDLAPLLALFGERFTMQFMSESMGWADNIVLAMAPLGVITIIVGAIRVGGPSWLKAIIGRARENLAVAEAELMSSTSKEVCELWNGRGVVRVMGQGPIREFIVLLPEGENSEISSETDSGIGIKKLDDVKEQYFQEYKEGGVQKDLLTPEIVIVRNTGADAPNITLNTHDHVGRMELRMVAVIGVMLQLGVLIYCGFATYHPALELLKDGLPIAEYAFPCTAVGTLILVGGMLICSHVVESSTEEDRFLVRAGRKAQIVWLQRTGMVNDQSFEPSAVFAGSPRTLITTSRRARNIDANKGESLEIGQVLEEEEQRRGGSEFFLVLELKTIAGTMSSVLGFIVQFIGLRGMHWSASIAQLGAVLLMTVLRAWVRRGLAKPLVSQPLPSGYELDWFAMTFGDIDKAPWRLDTSNRKKEVIKDWKIATGGGPKTYKKLEQTGKDNNASSKAHKVMIIRRDLGRLAQWHGPASAEALALARAIEVTMDALFSDLKGPLTWSLNAHYAKSNAHSIDFQLERQNGKWKVLSDAIEAALSLWLCSVDEQERGQFQQEQERQATQRKPPEGDAWLRAKGSPARRSLRLLGPENQALRRDFGWWIPRDTARVLKIEEDKEGALEVENHRIVGCGRQQAEGKGEESNSNSTPQLEMHSTRYKSQDTSFELPNVSNDVDAGNALLATESYDPLQLLYAQDLFAAFMSATAKTLEHSIKGPTDIRPEDTSGVDAWKSFTLRNDQLSAMVHEVHNTGLGSLDQIYLSIIPSLSMAQKLPEPDKIITLARERAKPHERAQHWKQAGDTYLWLFRTTKSFPPESNMFTKATAVLMEYLRTLTLAIELREHQHYEERDIKGLKDIKWSLEKELRSVDGRILSSLMTLYKKQGREWKCGLVQETGSAGNANYQLTFASTKAHELAQSQDLTVHEMFETAQEGGKDVNRKDILDWTRLHYVAAEGQTHAVMELLEQQADINARDFVDWTPLHYACQHDYISTLQTLLREGAELNVQGRNGVAPLHCAATSGHVDAVRTLIEAGAALDVLDASGNTPLHWAAYKGHKDVVEYLQQDANKKLRDNNGQTALHLAAIAGMEETVKLLVRAGADKEAKDRGGRTPLHGAAEAGHEAVVKFLVEEGADKEAKDLDFGRTPLHGAAEAGHEAVVKFLVEEGADKEAKDRGGRTPLHGAAEAGHEAVVKFLVEEGADKEAKDNLGITLLQLLK
ncbi:hypothetical protein DL768_007293 [Monosporascus sp. mg162]|nr:hypothetical protein DL768_007293 [Monosporascus sp. mg162]